MAWVFFEKLQYQIYNAQKIRSDELANSLFDICKIMEWYMVSICLKKSDMAMATTYAYP